MQTQAIYLTVVLVAEQVCKGLNEWKENRHSYLDSNSQPKLGYSGPLRLLHLLHCYRYSPEWGQFSSANGALS